MFNNIYFIGKIKNIYIFFSMLELPEIYFRFVGALQEWADHFHYVTDRSSLLPVRLPVRLPGWPRHGVCWNALTWRPLHVHVHSKCSGHIFILFAFCKRLLYAAFIWNLFIALQKNNFEYWLKWSILARNLHNTCFPWDIKF